MIKSTPAVRILLGLGLCIVLTGVGALAFQTPSRESPPVEQAVRRPEAKSPRDGANWKVLAGARVETAREIVDLELQRMRNTVDVNVLSEIPPWSQRLMEDRLLLASSKEERVAAIREHWDRMREVEQLRDRYSKAGQGRTAETLKARYYRLTAEQGLIEQGVDVSKILPHVGLGTVPTAPSR